MFSLQMQLTRSKLKYWTSSKSRCFAGPNDRCYCCCCWSWYCCWCCWHLPCLCIAAGKQYLFLTSSSVVGEPTSNTLRRLYGVRLHFVVQMVYMTILTIHPGMPIWKAYVHACCRQSERVRIMFHIRRCVCVGLPCAFHTGEAHIVVSHHIITDTDWVSLSFSLKYIQHIYTYIVCLTNGTVRNAMQNPLLYGQASNMLVFFSCFRLFLHSFFFLLHYIMCHWFAFSEWIRWFQTQTNRSSVPLSALLNDIDEEKKQKHNTCFPHVCI